MSTQDIRDYFCRHFLGKVKVHNVLHVMPAPQVLSARRVVGTSSVRMKMNVAGSTFFTLSGLACSNRSFRFSGEMVKVRGAKIARYQPDKMETHVLKPLRKTAVKADRKRAEVLPQERTNRLQWQTARPRQEGEMLLAWFGPIIEEAVVRLTLNKQQGTLLIWYNPQSRRYNARGLYLYRRLGIRENLEWRWV